MGFAQVWTHPAAWYAVNHPNISSLVASGELLRVAGCGAAVVPAGICWSASQPTSQQRRDASRRPRPDLPRRPALPFLQAAAARPERWASCWSRRLR